MSSAEFYTKYENQMIKVGNIDADIGDVMIKNSNTDYDFRWINYKRGLINFGLDNWKGIDIPEEESNKDTTIAWSPSLKLYVLTVYNGTYYFTSTDGDTWTEYSSPLTDVVSICWSPDLLKFCMVGNSGTVCVSTDGINWTSGSYDGYYGRSVCWSHELSLFCFVCNGTANAFTSSDGLTWTKQTLPSNAAWTGVCWCSGLSKFCAVSNTIAATSPDGITWTEQTISSQTKYWVNVAYSTKSNIICAVGSSLATSKDGISWQVNDNITGATLCYSEDYDLFAITSSNSVYTSQDAKTWTAHAPISLLLSNETFNQIIWVSGLNRFTIAGTYSIYHSTQVINEESTTVTFRGFRYIRDWINGSNSNTSNHWCEISVYDTTNTNIALNLAAANLTTNGSIESSARPLTNAVDGSLSTYTGLAAKTGGAYIQLDLGSIYKCSTISVFHYSGRVYYGTKLEVSADGEIWITVFDSAVSGTYNEGSTATSRDVSYI